MGAEVVASSDLDIFSGTDDTSAPATNSDPSQTDLFTPGTDLASSETEDSTAATEQPTVERDLPLPEPSSLTTPDSPAPDFSNDFEVPTDSDSSPLSDFTTPPETSPLPEPVLALAGPLPSLESTPPADASSPDVQLGLDSDPSSDGGDFWAPLDSSFDADTSTSGKIDPSAPVDSSSDALLSSSETSDSSDPLDSSPAADLSLETDPSSSDGDSTQLPERDSSPEGELPELGEGSNFEPSEFASESANPSGVFESSDPTLLSSTTTQDGTDTSLFQKR